MPTAIWLPRFLLWLVLLAAAMPDLRGENSSGGSAPSTSTASSQVGATTSTATCHNWKPPPKVGPCDRCIVDICGGTDCPSGSASSGSIIDNTTIDYRHDGIDFTVDPLASAACVSCGDPTSTWSDSEARGRMPSLTIDRVHRPMDLGWHASFGPGVFWEYDATFELAQSDGSWSGTLFMPHQHQPLTFQQHGTSFLDGTSNAFHDITLFTAAQVPTADPSMATTAVLTTWEGMTYVFELVAPLQAGRLIRIADRNGNATVIAYQLASTATATDPALFWEVSTVTDAYGRQASFTYGSSPIAGDYVVTGIDVPGGQHITYRYDDPSLLGLAGVELPDGTSSWFTTSLDASTQCQVYRFFDASAKPLERRRDVYLSLGSWVDPTTHEIQAVSPNHVRMVLNGAGEVSYLTWGVLTPQFDQQEYVYEGGQSLLRFTTFLGFPVCTERALTWDWATDPSTWTWDLAAAFRTNGEKYTTMTADGLGRTTATPFDTATSTRPGATYADGSTTATTFNQFREPLRMIDELGRVTVNVYDGAGNLLQRTVAAGSADEASWSWTYNLRGQPLTMTDPDHHTTSYQYTPEGYLAAVIEPPDVSGGTPATWSFAYDRIGNRIASTDPSGRLVTTSYDARNRPLVVTYVDGSTVTTTYGSGVDANLPIASTDRNGNRTLIAYDGQGREIARTLAAGTPVEDGTTTAYLPGTNLVETQVVLGDTTLSGYDYQNRLITTTTYPTTLTALTTETAFDAGSEPVVTTDAYGRRTERAFDLRGRVVREAAEMVPGALASEQELIDAIPDPTSQPWTLQDLGAPPTPGTVAIDAGGIITMAGIGVEMWSDTEQFTLYDQPLMGDGSITARVLSQQDTDPWAKAGVMIRSADAPGAAYAALFTAPGYGVSVNDRAAPGLDTTYEPVAASDPAPPCWLRLERHGTDVRSYTSPDGVSWTLGNQTTVAFGAEVTIGLFVLAHESAVPCIARFDQVAVAQASEQSPAVVLALTQAYVRGLNRGSLPEVIIQDAIYDLAGEQVAAIDGRGIISTTVFDQQGRVIQQTNAAGTAQAATTFTSYDAVGNPVQVTDPLGRESVRTYSQRNLLLTQTDAAGLPEAATVTHTYTPTRQLLTTTTALGTTSFSYGTCCDRLVGITDAAGFQTSITYDAYGNRLSVTDGNGITSQWTFDARNRVATASDGAGEVTTYAYDDHLNDAHGLDLADGASISGLPLGPGADGSAVLVTDPLGHATLTIRDGINRILRVVDPLTHATTTTYDQLIGGLVATTTTDAVGDATQQRADARLRLRQAVDALGQITTMSYDGDSNLISLRDPNGVGDDWQFDALNRQVLQTDTQGSVTGLGWDLAGNRILERDAFGQAITHAYDGLNRVISTTDRIGAITRFTYDAVGNLLTMTDAELGVTTYGYDARSLLISESFPGAAGGVRSYAYDGGGRLIRRTDQAGVVTTYAYDTANRLTTRSYPGQLSDRFSYDAAGKMLQAISGRYENTVIRGYDAANRLTDEALVVTADPLQHTTVRYDVMHGYDDANRQTLIAYPDGTQVHRQYTPRNQLASVSTGSGLVASRSYDAGGRLLSTLGGNGRTETRTYGLDNLPRDILVPGVNQVTEAYDANKRIVGESEVPLPLSPRTQHFGYDAEDRLVDWQQDAHPHATQTWLLSPVADWQQTTIDGQGEQRSHNAVHEITQIDQQPLAWDPRGNLIADPTQQLHLAWDPEDQLRRVERLGTVAHYGYDALGRRVRRTVGDRTTTFVSAGAQVVWETDTDQAVYQQFAANGGAPTPARPLGGIITGADVVRIAFLPASAVTPVGFSADHGEIDGAHSDGLSYGWVGAPQPYTSEYQDLPLPPFDGNDALQGLGATTGTWQIHLPDGSYPVVVVMGDAEHRDMTNDVTVGGVTCNDSAPDSPTQTPPYEQGRFVGYAVQVHVHHGAFAISAQPSAVHARICFLEIGPRGGTIAPQTRDRLAQLVQWMTEATAGTPPKLAVRAYVYGSYVDEPLLMIDGSTRSYLYANSRASIVAATDGGGTVVERYRYDAYGQRTVLDPSGAARGHSQIGNPWGFTGRAVDAESGLVYLRNRYYDPALGRFISRDPLEYVDGASLYAASFVPNGADPSGTTWAWQPHDGADINWPIETKTNIAGLDYFSSFGWITGYDTGAYATVHAHGSIYYFWQFWATDQDYEASQQLNLQFKCDASNGDISNIAATITGPSQDHTVAATVAYTYAIQGHDVKIKIEINAGANVSVQQSNGWKLGAGVKIPLGEGKPEITLSGEVTGGSQLTGSGGYSRGPNSTEYNLHCRCTP